MAEKKEYKTGTKRFYVSKSGLKTPRKEADKKNTEYKRDNYKQIKFLVRKDDTEVLEKLDSVPSKAEYILKLIRNDIKASK